MIGVYSIYSKSQDKYYIGKSKDIKKRILKHISDLKLNRHHSQYLQNVYNKYGLDDLEFKIVEETSYENSAKLEKFYIKKYDSYNNGFNCTLGGEWGAPGRKFSEETLKKLSDNIKGENNPCYGKWGDKNPHHKITKEIASYIWFYTHNIYFIFPKITRKQWIGHYGITIDIYKKIQSNKTWKELSQEINLEDEEMYKKTLNFIKLILSQDSLRE